MPSKLEEVVNQIARLQQMRSAGALSESEYLGLKENVLEEALPGYHGPEPDVFDNSLPYSDTQEGNDGSGLKRSFLLLAILAVVAAPLVTAGYYRLASDANFLREAGRTSSAPPPKIAARARAASPAPARSPAHKDEAAAPVSGNPNKALALQPPGIGGAVKTQAAGASLPTAIGQCMETVVAKVTRRPYDASSADISNFGSAIQYKNGGRQISSVQIGGIDASMPGDRIRLCLVSRPHRCAGGGRRGAVYHALNLRTGQNWDAANAVQVCGGT